MKLKDIDLNLIVVFNAIYKERHLTRAGQQLQRTPSAMSHALQRLRDAIGDDLFLRHGNEMVPTSVADAIATDLEKGLFILKNTLQNRGSFSPATSKDTFTLGLMDYCAFVVLPEALPRIKKLAPNLNIQVKHVTYDRRPEALESGEVDLIIGDEQHFDSTVHQQHLFLDQDVCIFRKDHPRIHNNLTLEDYLQEEFIALYYSNYYDDPNDTCLKQIGHKRKIALRLEHEILIPEMVAKTDYLANIAKRQALKLAHWQPINIRPIPLQAHIYNIYQYWHVRHTKNPGHAWLRKMIKEVCSSF